MKDKMIAYMKERKFCVISTIHPDGKPESAFVGYVNEGLDIYIGTSSLSRKFRNVTDNPSVAVVIADLEGEVQYEGQAQVLPYPGSNEHADENTANLPGFVKYREDPNQRFIKITPSWIRFIQHGENDKVEEFTEF